MIAEILIIGALIVGILLYQYSPVFRVGTYIAGIIVVVGLFFKFLVRKYDDYQRAIIFRMGKFHRIAGPGWSVVIPFFEKEYTKVDVRTKMMDLFIPVAFTSDDLRLKIDGVIYYRITDPNKAVLKIDNYMVGLTNILVSETRNLVSSLSMRDMFGKLDDLNELLAEKIRHQTWKWGIDVPTVQIRSISPPEEIAAAMQQKEIAAEFMQAQRFRAEAKKVAIEAVGDAAKKLDDRALMYLYLKALEEMSKGKATKVVFPMQFMDVMKGGFGLGTGLKAAGVDEQAAVNSIRDMLEK